MPDTLGRTPDGGFVLPSGRRLAAGFTTTGRGILALALFKPDVLIVSATQDTPDEPDPDTPMTIGELSQALARVLGEEVPLGEPIWLSRTRAQARLVDQFRMGRIFVAGDAAHLFPAGGAALDAGLTDAVNLAWKLRAAVRGWAPEGLLDSYDRERRAAAERALLHTRAQFALGRGQGSDSRALRELLGELLQHPEPLRQLGELLAGADSGQLAPNLPLQTAGRQTSVAELLRPARGVLIDLADGQTTAAAAGWSDRIEFFIGSTSAIDPPAALLIRPDGQIAWSSDEPGAPGLLEALQRWFGAPEPLLTFSARDQHWSGRSESTGLRRLR